MTPEDLDAFRRADPGYHYDYGEPAAGPYRAVLERWAIGALLVVFWGAVAYFIWGW